MLQPISENGWHHSMIVHCSLFLEHCLPIILKDKKTDRPLLWIGSWDAEIIPTSTTGSFSGSDPLVSSFVTTIFRTKLFKIISFYFSKITIFEYINRY